jgi:hypothetical protein
MNDTMLNTTIYNDETYWINVVNRLNQNISRYVMGLIWLMGNVGSILNCIVFHQPALRKSPCSMYFLASSVSQFFTFNFALLTRMLTYAFGNKTMYTNLWYCKFRFYLFYIFVAVPRYDIILASIDRYFASSRDALRRQWSSQKMAIRLIIGNIIFWSILYIQVLVFYVNSQTDCLPQNGVYDIFFSIYISIDSGILPLVFMLVFGLLTFNNVRKIKQSIRPTRMRVLNSQPNQMNNISKKDMQLIKILLNQIILFIIFNIINPCFLLYRTFTINNNKSILRQTVESFLSNMSYIFVYAGFSLTFVINISSSHLYQKEFKRLIQKIVFQRQTPSMTSIERPNIIDRKSKATTSKME